MAGLVFVFVITLLDPFSLVAGFGAKLKNSHGPNVVVFIIFFVSGLMLNAQLIRSGISDVKGTLLALILIFVAAPLLAALCALAPLDAGFLIGIFLVAAMPTTLSSGVVMTGSAGGNMAHALFITIVANALAIVTIPVTLTWLLALVGHTAAVSIDQTAIMIKLVFLVLLPLALGLGVKMLAAGRFDRMAFVFSMINQCMILIIVWMAISPVREKILANALMIAKVGVWVVFFHGALWLVAALFIRTFNLERGRRESVIFMGGQKTLPLSIILQMSLFSQYEVALVACVVHHIIHLLMDGYLVGKLAASRRS
jgi:solute carrier family 10 (sodium/bile acid cotransporter), member 7